MGRPAVRRGTVFVALVAYWAGGTLGSQFAITLPGPLHELWYSAAPVVVGLAFSFAAGLYIGRWWAVLAGVAPVVVLGVLELAGHIAPWHEAGPPLTGLVQYGVFFAVSTVVLFWLGPIAAGVALRKGLGPRHHAAALS